MAHNKLAYLGNDFPIEVVVKADFFNGSKTIAKITKENQIIASQEIQFLSDNEIITIPFKIEAKNSGKQKYIIEIVSV